MQLKVHLPPPKGPTTSDPGCCRTELTMVSGGPLMLHIDYYLTGVLDLLVFKSTVSFAWFIPSSFPAIPSLAEEVQRTLAMLIMLHGMKSDPSLVGVEKLVMTDVSDQWLKENRLRVSSSDVGADACLVPPQTAFAVKGWNRSVCALSALMCVAEMPQMLQAGFFDFVGSNISLSSASMKSCWNLYHLGQDMPVSVKEPLP